MNLGKLRRHRNGQKNGGPKQPLSSATYNDFPRHPVTDITCNGTKHLLAILWEQTIE